MAYARRVFVLLRIIFKYLKTGLTYQAQVLLKTATNKSNALKPPWKYGLLRKGTFSEFPLLNLQILRKA